MSKKITLSLFVATNLFIGGCALDSNMLASSGMDLLKAATISTNQMKAMATEAAVKMDAENPVAPANNPYAIRLKKITDRLSIPDNLQLNYKVYLSDDVNAFAMADGTVRVYKGLLDLMTDDEVLFVMGHEIGHVKYEHSKKAYRLAYAASAARKGAASGGGSVGAAATGNLGGLTEKLLNSQFSQREESQADSYGLNFLKYNHKNPQAAIDSLTKLQKLGGGESTMFSTHPSSAKRVADIKAQL